MPAPPLPLVAKALLAAWGSASPPPSASLAMALSWSIGEGAWASWSEGGVEVYPFAGTNNFGSIHATRSFAQAHAAGGGFGMVAFLDHAPAAYVTRMAVYPSLAAGAAAYLAIVRSYVDLANVDTTRDYSAQLYVHNYFEGFHPNRTILANRAAAYANSTWSDDDEANIADGAALLSRNLPAAQAAMAAAATAAGDPSAASSGPPFAPLAVRLTPAQRLGPHTLEHARTLLGAAATNPPAGAISLDDALASPGGDGVWMFPDGVPGPSPSPAPVPPAPTVPRVVAEELGGLAALGGVVLGLAGAAAVILYRPGWIPNLGGSHA